MTGHPVPPRIGDALSSRRHRNDEWDDYFERECGATPFVAAEDYVFWDTPGRKVFKLHGSINSLGSLVITREDYVAAIHASLTAEMKGLRPDSYIVSLDHEAESVSKTRAQADLY